jgi:hypothetical protein
MPGVSSIAEIHNPWRDGLVPASYRNVRFHCEVQSREGGRRVVEHQFPKKEDPFGEDMGREAQSFSIRAYYATFPTNVQQDPRYSTDYRYGRNQLQTALDAQGPGWLQLPTPYASVGDARATAGGMWVICSRYRMTEEEKLGGFVIFDIVFQEFGIDPARLPPQVNTRQTIIDSAAALRSRGISIIQNGVPVVPPPIAPAGQGKG